ncbi:MAG: valine--pyruvate transaminase [Treponema sp.]|nr:valine--pyruvate transaminase [Treponema sp.]
MTFSDFGNKLCGESGILQLMDDIGKPLPKGVKPYRLGGGNPAQIPQIQQMYRRRMEQILNTDDDFENLIGFYDSPQGRVEFIETVAEFFKNKYGWNIDGKNVAVSNGSQSACFYLFNLLAGTFTENGRQIKKRILFPLAPDYIGYADQGIEKDMFVSIPSTWEEEGNNFKYHVNFELLENYLEKNFSKIGAMCVTRPTNPTGNVLTDTEVKRLSSLADRYNVPLIIDNAYGLPWPNIIFTDDASPYYGKNIILSMSLSKIGLPSLRTGIIIADEQIVKALGNLNAIAALASGSMGQAIASPLIRSGELVQKAQDFVRPYYENKAKKAVAAFHHYFEGTDYRLHKSEGSIFQWILMNKLSVTSKEFYSKLKEKGVIVVPGEYFFFGDDIEGGLPPLKDHAHYSKCLRINYAGPEDEVEQGIKIIADMYRKFSR